MRTEYKRNETLATFWGFFGKELGTIESAKKELGEIIGSHGFETVKPIYIIERLCFHTTGKDSIILTFLSGTVITAHAVI